MKSKKIKNIACITFVIIGIFYSNIVTGNASIKTTRNSKSGNNNINETSKKEDSQVNTTEENKIDKITYTYGDDGFFRTKEFKDGKNHILIENDKMILISEKDTDGDGLLDYMEDIMGYNKNKKDTDGDGLNDGFEYKYLNTDVLKKDSDGNGISDADEDYDKDGVSNIKEQELGTNPNSVDSDNDGLTDYEEINKYHTNPLNHDTDKDGLSDNEEIKLGLDPNKAKTDGVTIDSERLFEQSADESIKSRGVLESDNWLSPSISGKVHHDISDNVGLDLAEYPSFKDNKGVVSDILKYKTSYDIPVKLTFSYKTYYLGDIKNLTIVSYIEGELKIVDTTIDTANKKIYGMIEDAGEYFVIDIDKFLKEYGIDVFAGMSTWRDVSRSKMNEKTKMVINLLNILENKDNKTYNIEKIREKLGFKEIDLKSFRKKLLKKPKEGYWLILDDYSRIRLKGKIADIKNNDTDRDGLTDAEELGIGVDIDMSDYINLLLDRYSIPRENYNGEKSIIVWRFNSNPTELDTDFDGLPDGNIRYSDISGNFDEED